MPMDITRRNTSRRSVLGILGLGTAAIASRTLTGCGSNNPNAVDAGNGFDGGYNYPDGAYNVPDTDAGESCTPTRPDAQGPFFVPGAPNRTWIATAAIALGALFSRGTGSPMGGL